MTALQRTALGITAALLIALVLLLPAALANAQEPPESGTRLEPGVNLVGWVGKTTPVSQLFNEIPQLESIWAWDAELDDWIVAGRSAPEWLGGLGRIAPGMGLRMHLAGDQPYLWQRSTEPTRGLVKLRTGWNLVAWSGADGMPIDDAVKGVGWSLRSVHRWDAATQQWTSWTSPERSAQLIAAGSADQEADDDSEMPAVRRGEALWIEVARAVNWLQPTDILPRLVFPGGASQQLQTRVREDLEAVLAFFRDQYGIQATPDFTIYAAKDVDALIQAWRDDGEDVDEAREASTRTLWDLNIGWASADIVVKQVHWPKDPSGGEIARGRYHITHEYFHILQRQLSNSWASQWLVEGTADWVEGEHKVLDGERTLDNLRDRELSEITDDTPTLRSTEHDNAQWEYTLGWLAIDQLTASTAPEFSIEFWRQLASTEIGPHRRWTSTYDWQTALQQVSGQTVPEFYKGFDAWQREQAATNAATPNSYEYDDNWIHGSVTNEDGAPVAGVFVNAIRVEGEASVGWNQRAETDANGEFAVRAPEDGDYRLSVNIDDCTRYYSDGQLINDGEQQDDRQEAHPVTVSQSDVTGIDIQLPPNVCGEWQIRGRVVGPNAEPLVGILVSACPTGGGGQCHSSASAVDGSFAVAVAESGEYRVHADLSHGCSIYFRSGVPTTNSNSASPIIVTDAHVSDILIQVPEDLCRLRVGGFLDGIERFLDGYVSVGLCRITDDGCGSSTGRRLEDDGTFVVATPTSGAYRLTYDFDGCSVHYGPTGVTVNAADAALINIDSRDVRVAYRQVPVDVCAYEIGGALIAADGQPLADTYISACLEEGGECVSWLGTWADDDGKFTITVPADGTYRPSFNLDGCTVHFGQGRLTSNREEAQLIRVAGRSVQLSQRQVPAGMCAYQIRGSIAQADGQPLADAWVSACVEVDGVCAAWPGARTDDDGAFAITVPIEGRYRVSFNLEGCTVYFRSGGLTATFSERGTVRIEGRSVRLGLRQIPAYVCGYQIAGSITQTDGQPLADAWVSACVEVDGVCVIWRQSLTDNDGAFAITVPEEGMYNVSFSFEGCAVYFRRGGLTTNSSEQGTVTISRGNVHLVSRQIPEGMCPYRISGRFVDSGGAPLSERQFTAYGAGGERTDPDGYFEIRVPSDGAYTVGIELRSQPYCWHDLAGQALGSWNNPIRVNGTDVTDITLRLPGTIEDLCG